MRVRNAVLGLALLPLLAACGAATTDGYGGEYIPYVPPTGSSTATASYAALYDETRNLRSQYATAPTTRAAQLPASGQALYQGTTTIRVPTADSLSLLGDASILANFSDDRVTGRLGNFTSVRTGQNQAQSWDGTLSVSSAVNQGINVSRPNYVRGNVVGTITQGQNILSVDGIVDGNFRNGAYANGQGLTAAMQDGGTIRYNGRTYATGNMGTTSPDGTPAGLSIVAER